MMKRILIIDDSETVRNFYINVLRSAGYEVVFAVDGAEGLEQLFSVACDLVLTDLNMPGMDGYEFSRRVRNDAQFDRIPIVIISTESEDRDKIRAFEAGANLYLVKPPDPTQLLETVQMMLHASR
jgi:two-component system, chemotaxis family, chemotaxis protein CheY